LGCLSHFLQCYRYLGNAVIDETRDTGAKGYGAQAGSLSPARCHEARASRGDSVVQGWVRACIRSLTAAGTPPCVCKRADNGAPFAGLLTNAVFLHIALIGFRPCGRGEPGIESG